jgi:parallel beta-helix repeat protein
MLMNNTVSNNSDYGIYLGSSSNNTLTNNIMSNNDKGIRLAYSSNNTLPKSTISGNTYNFEVYGTSLPHYIHEIDTSNLVDEKPIYYWVNEKDKAVPSNAGFVEVVNSTNISVRYLMLTNNYKGIFFVYTNDSRIENINVSNSYVGIWLSTSSNNTITNNLDGICLEYSSNNTLTKNIAFNNTCGGILLHASSNNTLMNNIVSNNSHYGIYPYSSSGGPSCNNIITNNLITNNDDGICLFSSVYSYCSNKIYLNNFINNNHNARPTSSDSTSIWSSLEKITYTYNGKNYTNYLSNYWDDYIFEENDTNGDGIGDTPYSINSDIDNYPLMQPWENYFAPTENKFDTEAPANPYPSIMGNHTGTIKPNHTVIATKLYTYPCEGTGGHTGYAEIRNATWNATATWKGHAGDWHNITFDKTVVLLPNKTYTYTIRTGSYPQIIHEQNYTTLDGSFINCTEFTDANGKEYDNWIPAIRLWGR